LAKSPAHGILNGSCSSFSCTSGKQSAKSPAHGILTYRFQHGSCGMGALSEKSPVHGILTYTIQFKMDLAVVFLAPAANNRQKVQLTAI
jgi:hypothetical protein